MRCKAPWVKELIEELLPSEVQEVFRTAAAVADQAGFPVYAVGGLVRDLLLRGWHEEKAHSSKLKAVAGIELQALNDELRARPDVDLVVEGNGLSVARELASHLAGKIRVHKWYGTAVLLLPGGLRVDVATARKEWYERPAAPPKVEKGSTQDDLYRRDFSINALAIRLNGPEAYQMVDAFGGLRDLEEGRIRALHRRSFIDDPSRIFRAIRFEQRFEFAIEGSTLKLLQEAIEEGWVGHLSGPKLWLELTYLLRERVPRKNLRRMNELGLVKFIHPHLIWTERLEGLLSRVEEVLVWYRGLRPEKGDGRRAPPLGEDPISLSAAPQGGSPGLGGLKEVRPELLYLMAWVDGLTDLEVQEVCQRLSLSPEGVRILKVARWRAPMVAEELGRAGDLLPGQLDRLLSPLPLEALLWCGVQDPGGPASSACPGPGSGERIRRSLALYLTEFRDLKPFLRGRDLVELGLKPGPVFKEILNRARELRLDGILKTREDEIQFVKEHYL